MGKNFYDDNKFQNLTEDLKNLPQITTPEDFEFKLMMRINNKNFSPKFEEEKIFSLGKFLKPAISLGFVMILFLVLLNFPQSDVDEPILNTPIKLHNSNSGSLNNLEQQNIISENKNSSANPSKKNNSKNELAVKSNQQVQFFGKTIDIDNALKQNKASGKENEFGVLAGSGNFTDFGVRIPPRKGELDSMRSKMDSIRNASKK
ncbi:MAG: hypothetical protein Fur0015_13470 [Ignavibacteriales bacterium]